MARQTINIGTSANKGDGDPLRTAFDKINDNFAELYARDLGSDSGTSVGGNLTPDDDGTYDLGSSTLRFGDAYIKDFIYLNGYRIEVTAGGALLVDGGAPAEVQDTVGSVFGDDSTLLVDGVNNIIPSANISGTEATNWDTAYGWGDHSAAGYAPQATTYTKVEVDAAIAAVDPFSGDVTGSVYADDSTLLVDGVNGQIVGDYYGTLRNQTWMAAYDGFLTIANGGSTGPGPIQIVASANLDLSAGVGQVINANRNIVAAEGVTGDLTGNVTGDVNGSVFADDSTLLVDGVNGTIPAANLSGALPAIDGSALTGVVSAFSDLTGTPTTLAGYGITDAYTKAEVDSAITSSVLPAGSTQSIDIVAQDSTLLVDSVNGTLNATTLTGALPAIDGSNLTGLNFYSDSDVDTHLNTGSAGSNEVLSWDGADYAWVAQSGGGSGLQSRSTATATTGSIPDGSQVDLDITGFKSYALLSITTDRAARVRLYVNGASRSSDASRAEGVDPTSDAGLIAEVITTGAETVIISPGAFGFNLEGTPTSIIPCRVTNKSGGASTVQVDLNILQLEA